MPRKFESVEEKRTYQSWADMKNRCNNPNNHAYDRYGGRGIVVCERWNSFANFLEDMGLKPNGMTIERIDVDGGYTPENCCWSSYKDQARNTRVNCMLTFDGKTQPLTAWAEELDISRTTLSNRIHSNKWSVEKALTTPAEKPYDPKV